MTIVVPLSVSISLEVVDLVVALRPDLPRDEVVDADDEDVLVVRAIEDPDLALAAACACGPATGSRGRAPPAVGTLNDVTGQPCGLNASMTLAIVPSLPAASMPWRTTRTECLASAQSRSWRSRSRSICVQRRRDRRRLVVAERRAGIDAFEADARAGLDAERVSEGGRAGHRRSSDRRATGSRLYDGNVPQRRPHR